jgi:DNA-binding XRE family transcriptional regulator
VNAEDLLNYRKPLGYTQEQMARALGVSRSSIKIGKVETHVYQRLPSWLGCEFRRRWKQRPEFGPVALVYADEPMRAKADHPIRMVFAHCELYRNNEVAIRQALRLRATGPFVDSVIVEPDGEIVWSPPDLLREFDSRRHLIRSNSKWLEPHLAKAKLKPNNSGKGEYEVKGDIDYPDVREWSWPVSQLPQVHETDT